MNMYLANDVLLVSKILLGFDSNCRYLNFLSKILSKIVQCFFFKNCNLFKPNEFGKAKKNYHCVIVHVIFVHRLVLGDQKFGFEEDL